VKYFVGEIERMTPDFNREAYLRSCSSGPDEFAASILSQRGLSAGLPARALITRRRCRSVSTEHMFFPEERLPDCSDVNLTYAEQP